MKKYGWIALLCAVTTGCAKNPMAPEDPMAVWAAAHAHEVCVLAELPGGIHVGVLVPLAGLRWDYQVMPISYCNPAE